MHLTSIENARRFFAAYPMEGATVLDIGSQDVNGSLRGVCPYQYTGVDFVSGRGVDVVLTDPYKLPMADGSVDIITSSSCFEHSELFWVLFLEIVRVLKPHGLFYLNVPSNGDVHRFPLDCWRFYPDAGSALATWARLNGYPVCRVESYTSNRKDSVWNDYVAVFLKDERYLDRYPNRITDGYSDYLNGSNGRRRATYTQDQRSPVWAARRIFYFLKTPGAVNRSFQIIGDILTGKRTRLLPEAPDG